MPASIHPPSCRCLVPRGNFPIRKRSPHQESKGRVSHQLSPPFGTGHKCPPSVSLNPDHKAETYRDSQGQRRKAGTSSSSSYSAEATVVQSDLLCRQTRQIPILKNPAGNTASSETYRFHLDFTPQLFMLIDARRRVPPCPLPHPHAHHSQGTVLMLSPDSRHHSHPGDNGAAAEEHAYGHSTQLLRGPDQALSSVTGPHHCVGPQLVLHLSTIPAPVTSLYCRGSMARPGSHTPRPTV